MVRLVNHRWLSRLCGNEAFILIGAGDDLHILLEGAVEGVGEGDGESRREKIDIKLQIALRIEPVNDECAAASIGRTHQIER